MKGGFKFLAQQGHCTHSFRSDCLDWLLQAPFHRSTGVGRNDRFLRGERRTLTARPLGGMMG